MAWIEKRGETYRINFRYAGRHFSRSLKTGEESKAEGTRLRIEETLSDLERGRLQLPADADVVTFVLSDGKATQRPKPSALPTPLTLGELRDKYVKAHATGAMEENSLVTVRIHLRHFIASLGEKFTVQKLTFTNLQEHIERRAKKKGIRKKMLSPATLRKEVASFRACWNWATHAGLVEGTFPSRGLKYPKADEKPPFQTWAEIERQIKQGGLSELEQRELWDCLYLTLPEIEELLKFVKDQDGGVAYPMFCFAAYTGARRSEILRVKITDLDLETRAVLLHEKKRAKGTRTTRRAPVAAFLAEVLREWLARHPGGPYLFIEGGEADPKAGMAVEDAHALFKATVQVSEWARLRGWHVFRHSFASNCAAKGVDQRLIDAWLGHTTEAMRRRYRHLAPDHQRQAIEAVFGAK